MKPEELHHILQAAASLTDEDQFVVVGSQAIVFQATTVPAELTSSLEADIYPRNAPELADEIDDNLGEGSMFHHTYGYWAHGVRLQPHPSFAGGPPRAAAERGIPMSG